MTLRIELCPYGAPALEKLRALIDDVKVDDPFLPMTVVVARGNVGLAVRRALAADTSTGGRRGVTNVSFVTLPVLADALVGVEMAERGRPPLTDAVLRASIRGALAAAPESLLAATRDHPSTVDALSTTYRELRSVEEATLDRMAAGSARAAEVVSVLREVRWRTSAWSDDVDALDGAAAHLTQADFAGPDGPVVLYLPAALGPPAARFVRALALHASCTAIIGVTGDERADELAKQLVHALEPDANPPWPDSVTVPVGHAVLSAPSTDAELLLVVRDLMERFEQGTPLERMAIAHAGSSQYVTLLHTMLRQAGIPFNGGGVRPLSSTVAGRTLLGVLQLPDHDWRREDVAAWMNTGPLVHQGRPIPATRWDVISAESGVTEGLDEWHLRVAERATALRAEAEQGEEDDDDDAAWGQARRREAEVCEALLAFLTEVATNLDQSPSSWVRWAAWAKVLLRNLVGGTLAMEEWPDDERAAAAAVEEAVDRLAVLEQLEEVLTPAQSRAALGAELAVPAPQTSRFGTGVWVTPISTVAGVSLDVLYVVGMNDTFRPRFVKRYEQQ